MTEFLLPSDIDEIFQRLAVPAQDFAGKTVLLTGGRGFLRRYFMDTFARQNEPVLDESVQLVALDNLITAGKEGAEIPEMDNVRFVNHDVTEPFDWADKVYTSE